LAETSVVKSRPSAPHGTNLLVYRIMIVVAVVVVIVLCLMVREIFHGYRMTGVMRNVLQRGQRHTV